MLGVFFCASSPSKLQTLSNSRGMGDFKLEQLSDRFLLTSAFLVVAFGDQLLTFRYAMDRSVTAYAVLASLRPNGSDLIDGLLPLFAPVFSEFAGQKFDASAIAESLGRYYALRIHPWALESLVLKFEDAGLLERRRLGEKVHEYFCIQSPAPDNAVEEEQIEKVLSDFVNYANGHLTTHELKVDEAELRSALLRQLATLEFLALALRRDDDFWRASPAPAATTITLPKRPEIALEESKKALAQKIELLCAGFIVECRERDAEAYGLLLKITEGALAAEAVLDFQSPSVNVRLDGLQVYLDGPILMALLGVTSELSRVYVQLLFDQLVELGASICTYDYYADEVQENLKSVLSRYENGEAFGETANRLRNASFKDYVETLVPYVRVRIRDLGIAINQPPTRDHSMAKFPEVNEERLLEALPNFRNASAKSRDAKSVASVIRARAGKKVDVSDFSKCGVVFITANSALVDVSNQHLIKTKDYHGGEMLPSLTDKGLAGLLWVVCGGSAKKIPDQRLVANCYNALGVRADIVSKIYHLLNEADPQRALHFRALMTKDRAGQFLMMRLLGDSKYVNSDNLDQIYSEIESTITEKVSEEKGVEIKGLRDELSAEIGARKKLEVQVQDFAVQLESINEVVAEQAVAGESQRLATLVYSVREARRTRDTLEKRIGYVFGSVFIILSLVLIIEGDALRWAKIPSQISLVVLGILAFWKIPDWVFGGWLDRTQRGDFERRVAEQRVDMASYSIDLKNDLVSKKDKPSS